MESRPAQRLVCFHNSLCGIIMASAPCVWEATAAAAAMATNHVKSRNAAFNMKALNIAMSADNTPAKNINT